MTRLNTPEELESFRQEIVSNRNPKNPCISICAGAGCVASGADEVIEAFEAEIKNISANIKCRTTFRHVCLPAITDVKGRLFKEATKIFKERYKDQRLFFSRGRQDLVLFAACGIDIMNIGPGLRKNAHIADEYAKLSFMVENLHVLKDTIECICC